MNTELADFFRFNLWANLRLLDACANLTDAQLDATMKGTYGSVRATLMHIFAGEEGYVYRFTGQGPKPALYELKHFPGFDELRRRAHQSGEVLISIAEHLKHGQILDLVYQGQHFDVPAILVLIQAISHGTDHRSQIATLLSMQDVTLPELDGWAYYDALSGSDTTKQN
jgi:uncharacterized damage-inducible protein DinB